MQRPKFPKTKVRWLAALIFIIILIKLAANYPSWVENSYSNQIYSGFSHFLRLLFGWLPFSFGDILYLVAILWLTWKVIKFFNLLFTKRLSWKWLKEGAVKTLFICIIIYIIFNLVWGLNYNREGIASQLNLRITKVDTAELKQLQFLLLQKVNESKQSLILSHTPYPPDNEMFKRAEACYLEAAKTYPFLKYKSYSVKTSLYGWWGNYLGFTGYYDPFTGEAQVNTTVPAFMRPYTTCHEIAHQVGYAKEEEANFVGYLAILSSKDTLFHYSAYLDLFVYANREVYFIDSNSARSAAKLLSPAVKKDIREWREFLKRHKNPFEPVIQWLYGNYLRANKQPRGMNSYNEVIVDLIAYYKKFGVI